jgi:hypothetical protein
MEPTTKVPTLHSFTEEDWTQFSEQFKLYRISSGSRRLPSLISASALSVIEIQEGVLLAHIEKTLKTEIPAELGIIEFKPAETVLQRMSAITLAEKNKLDAIDKATKTSAAVVRAEFDERLALMEDALMARIDILLCPMMSIQVAQRLQALRMSALSGFSSQSVTKYISAFHRLVTLFRARLPDPISLTNIFVDGLQPRELRDFVKQQSLTKWTDARTQALGQMRVLELTRFVPVWRSAAHSVFTSQRQVKSCQT